MVENTNTEAQEVKKQRRQPKTATDRGRQQENHVRIAPRQAKQTQYAIPADKFWCRLTT
jgi:hypothetical protein